MNQVHSRAPTTSPNLIDLSPAPPVSRPVNALVSKSSVSEKDKYLVLPFPIVNEREVVSYEASSAEEAGISSDNVISVEAAAGFLGVLRLHAGVYCVIASNIKQAGVLPRGPILSVSRIKLFKLGGGPMSKEDREFATPITKALEGGSLYYTVHCDLTRCSEKRLNPSPRVGNAFWWTWPMANNAGPAAVNWCLRTVYGFVGSSLMRFSADVLENGSGDFQYTLVSRRSRRRAGTRYITRGADALGDVANFVETEQIVWSSIRPDMFSSFLVIRGSVPVFWRQNNGIARPSPELDSDLSASRKAFYSHFRNITKSYGEVCVVSLVDKLGSEGVLANAFERHFELDLQEFRNNRATKLIAFDFHRHCAGKEYERGLAALLSRIRDDIGRHGFYTHGLESYQMKKRQTGVFRVNCVDCLDRTNVVQSIIARVALSKQLAAMYIPDTNGRSLDGSFRLYGDSEDRFKHVWGDNADQVSKQYSGTGALKTDFTRTGKRSTTGVIGDGMKSVMRMYYKNFVDEGRQESIDILCGNAIIQSLQPSSSPGSGGNGASGASLLDDFASATASNATPSSKASVWYKFQAQRMNAGGDRQDVSIELSDAVMYLATPEGVCVEYPRRTLTSWERIEEGRPGDRRAAVRLRLLFSPSDEFAAAASPLDLIFRGGVIARENFLRALLVWASPAVIEQMGTAPIRMRCMGGFNVGDHRVANWGLDKPPEMAREIVALVVPETYGSGRPWGLGAVPQDVDSSAYMLISALAVPNGGPAIAILASKDIAPTVMSVSETSVRRPPGPPGSPQGCGVAVSLIAGGTSMCFASLSVNDQRTLSCCGISEIAEFCFDITNQFHHVCIAGAMGELKWQKSNATGPSSRQWVHLGDGSACYSLNNGLSVMRNSFPGLKYNDILEPTSFWNSPPQSEGNENAEHIVTLTDGVTIGRPAPTVPKNMLQYVATLSNLCGKDIRAPPGTDSNIPLTTYVNIYSEYASAEAMGTKPTSRPTANPVWAEQVRLVFLPTDTEEIMSSFLMGQILIATPLSDTMVAGHFVIPMACAGESGGEFNVPVRLAGISTGRLQGFLHLMPLNEGAEGAISSLNNPSETMRSSSNLEKRSSGLSGANPIEKFTPPSRSSDSGKTWSASSLPGASTLSGFVPTAIQQRLNSSEVNEKLDAARKKGTKQIKSVVNRLSAFMGQSSQPPALPPRILDETNMHHNNSNTVGIISHPESKSESYTPVSGVRNAPFREQDDLVDFSDVTPAAPSRPRSYFESRTTDTGAGRAPAAVPKHAALALSSGRESIRPAVGANLANVHEDPLLQSLTKVSAGSGLPPRRPTSLPAPAADPLLQGLTAGTQRMTVQGKDGTGEGWNAFAERNSTQGSGSVAAERVAHPGKSHLLTFKFIWDRTTLCQCLSQKLSPIGIYLLHSIIQ